MNDSLQLISVCHKLLQIIGAGTKLFSSGHDCTIGVYDMDRGKQAYRIVNFPGAIRGMCYSSIPKFLITGGSCR